MSFGCEHCGDAKPRCFHCGCTVCGIKGEEQSATVTCGACRSVTHVRCSLNPWTGDSASRSSRRGAFYCCSDCALGVVLAPNPQWSRAAREWAERGVARRLSGVLPSSAGEDSLSPDTGCTPSSEVDDVEQQMINLQLRFEGWADYFTAERLHYGHSLTAILPPHLKFKDDAVHAAVHELLSPLGQARRLCGLDAAAHPIGSLIAAPSMKRMLEWMEAVKPRSSNFFLFESKAALDSSARSPGVTSERTLLRKTVRVRERTTQSASGAASRGTEQRGLPAVAGSGVARKSVSGKGAREKRPREP